MGTIVLLLFPSGRRALCEDGGSTRVPNPECCGKPPAAPRGSRDTRGQPRRHSGLPPHIRTSQDGPACPGAGGTEGHQPRADPSTSAFSAAARPDGAPAGLWVAGGTAEARGCLFPIPGQGLCWRGVPCSHLRRCPGAEVGGVVGEFPFALHLEGLRTLPRSPNHLLEGYLEVPSWTTAAVRARLGKLPLHSAQRHRAAQRSPPAPPGCGGIGRR